MRNQDKPSIGVIGFGRFGQLLTKLLMHKFNVLVFDSSPMAIDAHKITSSSVTFVSHLEELISNCNTFFIAVPIRKFANIIEILAKKLNSPATIIDVCSVKIYPTNIMLKHLPDNINIIATHPLFGPDSINSPNACKIMMHQARGAQSIFNFWKLFFQQENIQVLEMTPEQHDEQAARSQSITHFIGRVLDDARFDSTDIDTKGFQELLKLKQQTCNDSWELFYDLLQYNPYSKRYINQFIDSIKHIQCKISDNTDTLDPALILRNNS